MSALLALVGAFAALQEAPALGQAEVAGLVSKYKETKHWALKAIALSALGTRWHPAGAEAVLDGLKNKDRRLAVFAHETLIRAEDDTLRAAATKEIVEALVGTELKVRSDVYRDSVMALLARIAPDAGAKDPAAWAKWWKGAKEGYAPAAWKGAAPSGEVKEVGSTRVIKLVERAFDLNAGGLEMVICIDSTGSMQPTIDATRDGLKDLVAILGGIAPRFRLGLVHYKDVADMAGGAQRLVALTESVKEVEQKLAQLQAVGGGDFPESVEKGLEAALDPKMGWQPTTSKAVILVGDAPPHGADIQKAVALAKAAGDLPAGRKVVSTGGSKARPRPFAVSAVAVALGGRAVPSTEEAFRKIAEAGGGSYGEFTIDAEIVGGKIVIKGSDSSAASSAMARRMLALCFGQGWEAEIGTFVDTYQKYRKAGLFQ